MSWSSTFRSLCALAWCAMALSQFASPADGQIRLDPRSSSIVFREDRKSDRPEAAVASRLAPMVAPQEPELDYYGNPHRSARSAAAAAPGRSPLLDRSTGSRVVSSPVVVDAKPEPWVGRVVASADPSRFAAAGGEPVDVSAGTAVNEPADSASVPAGEAEFVRPRPAASRVPLMAARTSAPTAGAINELVYTSTGPAVRVDARGPREVTVGVPAKYTLTLQNQSAVDARGVFVRVAIPGSVEVTSVETSAGEIQRRDDERAKRHLVWMFDRLPAAAKHTLDMVIRPTAGGAVEMDVEWTFLPRSETMQIVTLRPELSLAIDGPAGAVLGDKPLYTVQVENPGNGPANDIVVELSTNGGRTRSVPLGSLAPGEATSFQIELADLAPGRTELSAVAGGAHGLRSVTALAIEVSQVQLEAVAYGPSSRVAGAGAAYQFDVRNSGDVIAHDVAASIHLPYGITPVALPESAYETGDRIAWPVGDLAAGEKRTYQIECELVEAGDYHVEFRACDNRQNRVAADLVTVVEATPDVRLSVAAADAKVPVGESFAYKIELENRGTKAAELVEVAVDLATGVEPLAVDGGVADLETSRVTFMPLARLEPDERKVLTVQARGSGAGRRDYRVDVKSAGGDVRLAHEGSITFFAATEPVANVEIQVDTNRVKVPVGEELVYDIQLENTSNTAAEDVRLLMHFARGVEPVSVAGAKARISGGTVTFAPLARLERGRTHTVSVTAVAHRPGNHTYRAEVTTAADTRLACEGTTGCFLARDPGQPATAVAERPDSMTR